MLPIDEIEIQEQIPDENPWLSIWFSPKQTAEWLLRGNATKLTTFVLIYFGGVAFGINQAEVKALGDVKESSEIFINVIIFSGIGGLIMYNVFIWGIDFVSTWLGGSGNFQRTQIAFAWSFVPSIVSLFIKLLMYLFLGHDMFTSSASLADENEMIKMSYMVYTCIIWLLEIYHIVLLVILVSVAQKYSFGNSFLSLIGGALILIVPLIALVFGLAALF